MAKVTVLFGSATVGKNATHVAKGTIRDYDDVNDAEELKAFRAAGRIAPVTRENVAIVVAELKKKKEPIPAELQAAFAESNK